ncbi:branched-chain amino acid ABC transporter permease [Planosporangium mesophilum]|uniref:Branched-chain amino acid ABC transporter permease n=1 Tax=Planosporangium mesophilum TaxID=689768 RepID=A0A8J3TNA7_9ACTN|nr:branched-chain amino acid ABC transporter permease [Planosporangium mesophilum]NJC85112.1 branched-chain amino acid ABC transporter permease [Planosporangium mesophilum]GII24435.1 branched-chain amino acid ABC transporter permease [Planosporangium mesophilum]
MTAIVKRWWPLAALAALVCVPYLQIPVPGVLPDVLNRPGSLQLIAICLLFAGFAVTYDLLFGHTGLLSFGHALYVAAGSYTANIVVTKLHWGWGPALIATAGVGLLLPVLLGAVALRVRGIAFAMVTLAFAQVGSILVMSARITGGEEGLSLSDTPEIFAGVANTFRLYWLALAYLVLVVLVVRWSVESEPGRVWRAIGDNERRVTVLGLSPYRFRLLSYVLSAFLATLGGVVHLLLLGGSNPQITTSAFTVGLLVMTVLGGAGTRWGALLGGVLYTYLDQRLAALAGSDAVAGLPAAVRLPLEQPQFILGVLFMVVVYFLPGGLAGLSQHLAGLSRHWRRAT